MNTKVVGITIIFAAITVILQPLRIPALILPGINFGIYEIPIMFAFFLYGPKIGILVGFLHFIGRITFF